MSVPTDLVFESTSTLTQDEFFDCLLTRPPSDCNHYELLHGRVVMTVFAAADRWNAMPPPPAGKFLRIVADLVVEILSGSTSVRDRGVKRDIYGQDGIREYWIVDPDAGELTVFSHREDRFDAGRVFPKGVAFDSAVPVGLAFEAGAVLPD
jgi:putative restriction endonuclease